MITEQQEQNPPKGCVWKRADLLKAGDKIAKADGGFHTVKHTERANWIRTAAGPCVWIFWRGGGDEVASRDSEFAVRAPTNG